MCPSHATKACQALEPSKRQNSGAFSLAAWQQEQCGYDNPESEPELSLAATRHFIMSGT